MSRATTLCTTIFCVCVVLTFSTKFDYVERVDFGRILSSKRLVNQYMLCFTDKKPCTFEGELLKRAIPEILRTHCAECSVTQRNKGLQVMRTMQRDYPVEWQILMGKWDPDGNLMYAFEMGWV